MASTIQRDSGPAPLQRVLLSRQPIFQADLKPFGYELLFRYANGESGAISDGAQATAQVIVNGFMEVGLDALVGREIAFINFERTLLMGGYCEALPPDRVVLEVLETVAPDAALMKKLDSLRAKGYRIALDDFVCSPDHLPLLEAADFVKVDVLGREWSDIEKAVSVIGKYPAALLAEKVEDREQVENCRKLGFQYFQGYFFCRPQNVTGKPLPANRLAMMHLLTQLNRPDIKIEELEAHISKDVSLSYKLLRYINSAMCSLDRHVESIRHATVLVGLERMRVWATLIVFSGVEEAGQDVIVTGAIRARMCEQLAATLRLPHPERFFLTGLLSVLDAILDRPMPQVLPLLSLSDEIKDALLHRKGSLGDVLTCVQAYERRDWSAAETSVRLIQDHIEQSYQEALAWSAGMVGLSGRRLS
jgi:EAL and modified HD-GYP domain-containing signal transduction protein